MQGMQAMNFSNTIRKIFVVVASTLLLASAAQAGPTYGLSVRMAGWANDTAAYAYAFPSFRFTNLSDSGISITSLSMDDGSGVDLWDFVTFETASAGVGFTLTQGDYVNDSGWNSTIAYAFSGFAPVKFMEFYLDPDTLHCCTGNVVDARSYVFAGGKVNATFSNGETLELIWNNPVAQSFDPLRRPDALATDDRNIYYEMSHTVTLNDAPEPQALLLFGAALAALGLVRRRNRH